MPYIERELPRYPVSEDTWSTLAAQSKPVVIYGMGNGADKLIDRLAPMGIEISDVFASDGFVRGHSYRGMQVRSLSEIKEKYDDFLVLLSFASRRPEVLKMLNELDRELDLIVPDMPVAGMDEYFDSDFYNKNYNEILRAYRALADGDSRSCMASVMHFKLTGRMQYLEECYSEVGELYDLINRRPVATLIDAGAYNGDTVREAIEYLPGLRHCYAVEPDVKNYKRLLRYVEGEARVGITPINAAAHREAGQGSFSVSGNRNSTLSATASYEHKQERVPLIALDSLTDRVDYIKYDVEGAELEALEGSRGLIERCHPTLLVSAYHRSRDLFSLVNYIKDNYPFYNVYLRRLRCLPAWEIDIIAVDEGHT